MAGGARYPFPKHVWSPSGGWWSQPKNWKMNTALTFGIMGVISWQIFKYSADNEIRLRPPVREIPSARWSKNARDIGVLVEE